MAPHSRLARWATLILSCLLVSISGLVVVVFAPIWGDSASSSGHQSGGPLANWPGPGNQPIAIAVERTPLPPDQMLASGAGSHLARYDNIGVEVKRDGTLRVLGERMGMDAFRTLLGDQMQEQLQTMVTIYPDDNCPFRHVGPVISICEEAGVPHQTQPSRASAVAPRDPA